MHSVNQETIHADRGTGAEMCPEIVSGIVSGDAPVRSRQFLPST